MNHTAVAINTSQPIITAAVIRPISNNADYSVQITIVGVRTDSVGRPSP